MAFISGLQGGVTARGFGAGFFGIAARFGMGGDSLSATRFGLLQGVTRGSEGGIRFGDVLCSGLLFSI
jgi:hypothetical protein